MARARGGKQGELSSESTEVTPLREGEEDGRQQPRAARRNSSLISCRITPSDAPTRAACACAAAAAARRRVWRGERRLDEGNVRPQVGDSRPTRRPAGSSPPLSAANAGAKAAETIARCSACSAARASIDDARRSSHCRPAPCSRAAPPRSAPPSTDTSASSPPSPSPSSQMPPLHGGPRRRRRRRPTDIAASSSSSSPPLAALPVASPSSSPASLASSRGAELRWVAAARACRPQRRRPRFDGGGDSGLRRRLREEGGGEGEVRVGKKLGRGDQFAVNARRRRRVRSNANDAEKRWATVGDHSSSDEAALLPADGGGEPRLNGSGAASIQEYTNGENEVQSAHLPARRRGGGERGRLVKRQARRRLARQVVEKAPSGSGRCAA